MTQEKYNLVARFIDTATLDNIPDAGIEVLYCRLMKRLRARLAHLLYLDNIDDMSDHDVLIRLRL